MAKFETEIKDPQKPAEEVFNPLDEPVNEKRYTQPNVNTAAADLNKPIGEPNFAPPPMPKKTPPVEEKKREPVNPDMKQIPKKETEMASKQAAALIMQGYEWVHDLANKGLKVSEKKLNRLQAEGELNLNAMIDYDYGKQIRAGEFFKEYNTQVHGLLKVSDEFKEEVTPVLERVLAKRGIGLTDEQYLMYLFGKDLASKSIIFFQQKAQLNYMIESIKQATTSQFVQQAPPPPPSRPQESQPKPPEDVVETIIPEEESKMAKEPEEASFEKNRSLVKKRVGRPRARKNL